MANDDVTTGRELDPDLMSWEQQPDESRDAYQAFVGYRDSDKRRIGDWGSSAFRWAGMWSWRSRVYDWDLFMARADADDLQRYRRRMNETHRNLARAAQGKVLSWLQAVDPSKMSTAEATRLLEVSVRIERAAAAAEPMPEMTEPAESVQTGLDNIGDLDLELADIAKILHQRLK